MTMSSKSRAEPFEPGDIIVGLLRVTFLSLRWLLRHPLILCGAIAGGGLYCFRGWSAVVIGAAAIGLMLVVLRFCAGCVCALDHRPLGEGPGAASLSPAVGCRGSDVRPHCRVERCAGAAKAAADGDQ